MYMMKLLERCILLTCVSSYSSSSSTSSSTTILASAASAAVHVDARTRPKSNRNRSSLSSSSSSSSSTIELPFIKKEQSFEYDTHEQQQELNEHDGRHEQHLHHPSIDTHPQSQSHPHAHVNNSNSSNSNNRRYLREWEESLNAINFMDGVYEFYNPMTYRDDYVSTKVVLSADGTRLAIRGTRDASFVDPNPGFFYALYNTGTRDSNTEWIYETASTTTTSILYGSDVSISADSNEIAIGSNSCDTNQADVGRLCVYVGKMDNNSNSPESGPMEDLYVNQIGGVGVNSLVPSFGVGIALSGEGVYTVVGSSHGIVYVYNTPTMLLLSPGSGSTINLALHGSPVVVDQDAIDDGQMTTFGELVKIAGEESVKTFVVGGRNSGKVAVYRYDENTRRWLQLGDDITANGDEFSISDNGTVVAVKHRNSEIRVFQLINTAAAGYEWRRMGANTISVDADKTPTFSSSSNGRIIAVGAYKGARNTASPPGRVDVYEYVPSTNTWRIIAAPLIDPDGRTSHVDYGRSVSLSGDGMSLAVAAPAFVSALDPRVGYVKVYDLSDPFPSSVPSGAPVGEPSRRPTVSPSKSAAPSSDPATQPSAVPSARPSTSEPSKGPTMSPTMSFTPSIQPTVSIQPSIRPTGVPTSSTCESNCDCSDGSPFCTLSLCRFNCNCDEGGCDLSLCEYDCRCKGGNCNMRMCEKNCQCEGRNCQMDNCIYNGRCNSGGSGLLVGMGRDSVRGRMVVMASMLVGLVVVVVVG